MFHLLDQLGFSKEVQQFFSPLIISNGDSELYFHNNSSLNKYLETLTLWGNRVPNTDAIWALENHLPSTVSKVLLFHSAFQILTFCNKDNFVFDNKNSNYLFVALGLRPSIIQIDYLRHIYTNANFETAFGCDLPAHVLTCKVGLWLKGKDGTFSLENNTVKVAIDNKTVLLKIDNFSFNQFQVHSGLRLGIRTRQSKF
jgi:hypothetical protein